MPGLGRDTLDTAGGTITGPGAVNVFVNTLKVTLLGDAVADHGSGTHDAATMTGHSLTVYCNGIAVCKAGDAATCGHTLSPGSANVFVNS